MNSDKWAKYDALHYKIDDLQRQIKIAETERAAIRDKLKCQHVEPASKDIRTLKQLAQEAYDAQDASNLSGVVKSFYEALCDLRQLPGLESNEAYQNHPITRVWVNKIVSLAGANSDRAIGDAYSELLRLKDAT